MKKISNKFILLCVIKSYFVDIVFGAIGLTPPHIVYIIADDLVSIFPTIRLNLLI